MLDNVFGIRINLNRKEIEKRVFFLSINDSSLK